MTTNANEPIIVDYYSDVLCVWAWIAQRRVEELLQQYPDRVRLRHHFMDVFGDVPGKIENQWQSRGGYSAFADHVAHSGSQFEHLTLHADLWRTTRPVSSFPAHLMVKAALLTNGEAAADTLALDIRRGFFVQALDISQQAVLLAIAQASGLNRDHLTEQLQTGGAYAALMADYQKAKAEGLKGSPSYVLDGGRQVLFGNVGYRVLSANVEELLRNPSDEASWC